MINLTHQLAVDYGKQGILVNAVAPGKIMTGSPEQDNPTATAYSYARTPFDRLGRPEDVAGAATYLASDDARDVSGINLLVDGGWMAYRWRPAADCARRSSVPAGSRSGMCRCWIRSPMLSWWQPVISSDTGPGDR